MTLKEVIFSRKCPVFSVVPFMRVEDLLTLKVKKRRIEVRNKRDEYVGALPDDLSKRLGFFLDAKSDYSTYVKAATKNSVDVFIREEKKGKKVSNFISFPDNIQDDMKMMIGKAQDGEETSEEQVEVEEEDTEESIDDIEELAMQNEEKDETDEDYFGIETDDDFDE